MKRILITCTLSLIFLNPAFTQETRREGLNAEKIAFFTRIIDLSPEEAKLFWPLYNEFEGKRDKIIQERNEINRNVGANFRNMSDQELEQAGDRLVDLNLKEAQLVAEYHTRFKEVLSPAKVVRLYHAEIRFKTYLLNQLRKRQEDQPVARRRF